jgi:hypothetical protein
MRLMLGFNNIPSLLVNVDGKYSGIGEPTKTRFDFWVVNGGWEGIYTDGFVTVSHPPSGAFSTLEKVEILSDNQDRLRGNYQDVFDNWDNPNYVAPESKVVFFEDDDIAF